MAVYRNGPALEQGVVVYQGSGATYLVPVADPDGTRPDLTGATAAWWVGGVPAGRPLSPQFSVADAPDAFAKALVVQADGVGGFRVVLAIAPGDLAGFAPTGLYQHEVWVTELGKAPYPVTIGPLVIRGTVKGTASAAPSSGGSGQVGLAGSNTGFGSITYSHQVADPASVDPTVTGNPIAAGQALQLAFAPDPGLTQDHLNAPFIGQAFWDGTKVVGRAIADRLQVQVNLIMRSQRAGGTISLTVDTGSPLGPITADNAQLLAQAGVNERVTLTVEFETLSYVMANGAKLMLTATVPGAIFKESVIVAPQSVFVPRTS